ncbi:two-component response regulator [Gracilibacillus boraciitolerans JCM 21714]|uniref:Two-component response regulator n=1 Tax=Gracilibacillus boraciitolerans JCM 21714 TaxID=1298598 RepID=W4VNF8_9BACI|nr:helix-turn-helix domain-containing protein [Gracilibacillus boraciitolerans]GAE94378.1 two-component response regulator [Gracilibacillus boraciitolerans JCM 21714]
MEVVGEASNGQKALEFLKDNHVDLVLTDLNMPKMSGLEFMRIAKVEYPHIFIAVLTLHQDFEYIQEALRLGGAIDFITKIELEKEKFQDVLARVHRRIQNELPKRQSVADEIITTESIFCLYAFYKNTSKSWMSNEKLGCDIKQIDEQMWLCLPLENNHILETLKEEVKKRSGWNLLIINNLKELHYKVISKLLVKYKAYFIFYKINKRDKIYSMPLEEIEQLAHPPTSVQFNNIRKEINNLGWIKDQDNFKSFLNTLYKQKFSKEDLYGLAIELIEEWNHKYGRISAFKVEEPSLFQYWEEVEEWLDSFREQVTFSQNSQYSPPDILKSMWEAIRYIQNHLEESITAEYMAKYVNMSRSYFNRCFKEITGVPFHQYLRDIRMEKAKELLITSNEPIQRIAEHIGYIDEKYFSRLFKTVTGELPSSFRKRKADR